MTPEEQLAADQAALQAEQARVEADAAAVLAAQAAAAEPAAPGAPVEKTPKFLADIETMDFDNEAAAGVVCSIVFKDGTKATGTATPSGSLVYDQQVATAAALASTH